LNICFLDGIGSHRQGLDNGRPFPSHIRRNPKQALLWAYHILSIGSLEEREDSVSNLKSFDLGAQFHDFSAGLMSEGALRKKPVLVFV
jgi:hypothetical protein